jgi:phage shock protein PspC (stress-responsive transcriptional regulator)
MKKIININLSGRMIPMEDSAYDLLKSYLDSLNRYFAHEEGRGEIMSDIESRIAELFEEKIRKGAHCITDADVTEVSASIGRPEDFEQEEGTDTHTTGGNNNNGNNYQQSTAKPRGRLYRNENDKLLGGVCSGLANYLNIDPAIVRLLFAIVTFGGFGTGLLIYIILWIVLPAQGLESTVKKRLYRNPEDRMLGGVCSGLAAYFNKDVWIPRLIFAAPLILNVVLGTFRNAFYGFDPFPGIIFGSFSGTFILAYIVLWIVLPEAKTNFEKMEMRGEKVDINSIRNTVKEELQNFKGKAEKFGEDVKESAQKFGASVSSAAQNVSNKVAAEAPAIARQTSNGIGHVFGVIFKAFFLFIAGTIAFALFVSLIAILFTGSSILPIKEYILDGFWQHAFAWGTLIFFLGVPLVAMITWLIRRIVRAKAGSRYLGYTFGGLWTLGWISLVLLISSLGKDFRSANTVAETINISQPAKGRMVVQAPDPRLFFGNAWFDEDWDGWDLRDDSMVVSNVRVRIVKSEDSLYHVQKISRSYGKSRSDAMVKAGNIRYDVTNKDSLLNLASGFGISKENKFRGQQVMVVIAVPVGKRIMIDRSVKEKLNPVNIRVNNNRRNWGVNVNEEDWSNDEDYDYYYNWYGSVEYIMTNNGLERVDKKDNRQNNNDVQDNNNGSEPYRYKPKADTFKIQNKKDTTVIIKSAGQDPNTPEDKGANEEIVQADAPAAHLREEKVYTLQQAYPFTQMLKGLEI